MFASRGKRATVIAGTVAVVALVVAGFAAKDLVREQWSIWQHSSQDVQTRRYATFMLREMRWVRAMPELIRLLKEEGSNLSIKEQREIGFALNVLDMNKTPEPAQHSGQNR